MYYSKGEIQISKGKMNSDLKNSKSSELAVQSYPTYVSFNSVNLTVWAGSEHIGEIS